MVLMDAESNKKTWSKERWGISESDGGRGGWGVSMPPPPLKKKKKYIIYLFFFGRGVALHLFLKRSWYFYLFIYPFVHLRSGWRGRRSARKRKKKKQCLYRPDTRRCGSQLLLLLSSLLYSFRHHFLTKRYIFLFILLFVLCWAVALHHLHQFYFWLLSFVPCPLNYFCRPPWDRNDEERKRERERNWDDKWRGASLSLFFLLILSCWVASLFFFFLFQIRVIRNATVVLPFKFSFLFFFLRSGWNTADRT